ncbi:hypothetical protein QE152_g12610 [Popillia japonica]|uniref:Uncharacterized protein n=1 Tax=Popillia japonica TaxID=7064 RepID=A0AAW1LR21_POPJA
MIYFELLHSMLFKDPRVNPIATCSSTGIIKIREGTREQIRDKREDTDAMVPIKKKKENSDTGSDKSSSVGSVNVLPMRKCAGVSTFKSLGSEEYGVNGLELRHDSIPINKVLS